MHELLGKKLFCVIAHPDDEAYLFASTAWCNHRAGGTTRIVCATAGERGMSHLPKPISPTALKRLRKTELQHACREAHMELLQLGLPDGFVNRHAAIFRQHVERDIHRWQPDVLVSFGPDGISGHRDHIACYRLSRTVARRYHLPFYVFTVPPRIRQWVATWLQPKRVYGRYHPIKPYQPATVRIPLPPKLKQSFLAHHQSQLDAGNPFPTFPQWSLKHIYGHEFFSRMD